MAPRKSENWESVLGIFEDTYILLGADPRRLNVGGIEVPRQKAQDREVWSTYLEHTPGTCS